MNGKNLLTLDFKNFVESTGLDYNEGTYVSHPSLEVVKAELAKLIKNAILLDRTPTLKTAFLMAWRILFTFVIKVLDENYLSTEQINSIQQLITYCLLIGTQVDIGEIIYSDLITTLTSKSRQKYISYPRFVSCALEVLLVIVNNHETSVSPLPFSVNKKKAKSQTMTLTLPKSHGPEASGALSKKRNKTKSKKTTPETQATPTVCQRRSLIKPRLPSTSHDKVTRKSQPLSEGKTIDPKDSGGNDQPADKGLPSMASKDGTGKTKPLPVGPRTDAEYHVDKTQSTRLEVSVPDQHQSNTSSEVELDFRPLKLTSMADYQA
ncbi:hypothetical protein Tco_0812201, partial [Tanacetum coccineum]